MTGTMCTVLFLQKSNVTTGVDRDAGPLPVQTHRTRGRSASRVADALRAARGHRDQAEVQRD